MRHRKPWIGLADAAVPTGTSVPLSRNSGTLFLLNRSLRGLPDDVRSITPHATQVAATTSKSFASVTLGGHHLKNPRGCAGAECLESICWIIRHPLGSKWRSPFFYPFNDPGVVLLRFGKSRFHQVLRGYYSPPGLLSHADSAENLGLHELFEFVPVGVWRKRYLTNVDLLRHL